MKGRAVAVQTISAAIAYVVLAIAYTWPLTRALATEIAIDPWDPILNTTVLWWNATHLPFSTAWWNAPQFYPSAGVSAFTENLMGISVIFSPDLLDQRKSDRRVQQRVLPDLAVVRFFHVPACPPPHAAIGRRVRGGPGLRVRSLSDS